MMFALGSSNPIQTQFFHATYDYAYAVLEPKSGDTYHPNDCFGATLHVQSHLGTIKQMDDWVCFAVHYFRLTIQVGKVLHKAESDIFRGCTDWGNVNYNVL